VERRDYLTIRLLILLTLSNKEKSVNQIAHDTKINWRTVAKHLEHLTQQGLTQQYYFAQQLKIYALTDKGFVVLTEPPQQEVLV
jgi:predicted transcriptional regulator